MTLSKKEIQVLKAARISANEAWEMRDRWAYGQAVSAIIDLGYSVFWLFVSDEVFEQRIKEYSNGE